MTALRGAKLARKRRELTGVSDASWRRLAVVAAEQGVTRGDIIDRLVALHDAVREAAEWLLVDAGLDPDAYDGSAQS